MQPEADVGLAMEKLIGHWSGRHRGKQDVPALLLLKKLIQQLLDFLQKSIFVTGHQGFQAQFWTYARGLLIINY